MKNKVKELHGQGLTNVEIARIVNRNPSTVANILKGLGLKTNGNQTNLVPDELMKKVKAGYSHKEMKEIFKCSHATLSRHIARLGLAKTRKVKKIVPNEIQRSALNKGYTDGVVKEVVLSPTRDDGRLVRLKYSDISDKPTVMCEIRVKDLELTDEEAVINWGKKMGKRSVCLA